MRNFWRRSGDGDHWSSNQEVPTRAASTSEFPPRWTATVMVPPLEAKKFSSFNFKVAESLAATMKLFRSWVLAPAVTDAVSIATIERSESLYWKMRYIYQSYMSISWPANGVYATPAYQISALPYLSSSSRAQQEAPSITSCCAAGRTFHPKTSWFSRDQTDIPA